MSENRSQDIQLIKLAAQVEKDSLQFLDKFIERAGASQIIPFLQQVQEESKGDLETIEVLLASLESEQVTNDMAGLSLDDYVKELQKKKSERYYPQARTKELLGELYNPIRVLGYLAESLNELADFYSTNASNIFYENEKNSFISLAAKKKDRADVVSRKRKEIITRFP